MGSYDMTDHEGNRLKHGRAEVNGIGLHYAIGGSGDPVLLLHGVPKTMYHWRKVIPLLTPHHTVVAADVRGFGDSERPATGYDTRTMAEDIVQLANYLGFERFRIIGEDWGAAIAYAVAAFHRDRVEQLVFQEMLLPGVGYEPRASGTGGNALQFKKGDTRTLWHLHFFNVPHYPELLISGRERAFWSYWMKREMYDPSAATDDDIDEQIRWLESPGGLHTIFEVYRANDVDAEQNRPQIERKLTIPVLAVGGRHFFGDEVQFQMEQVAEDVRGVVLDWGHNPALECPEELAAEYQRFFAQADAQMAEAAGGAGASA